MAIRVENFPKKSFDHQETSMPHFPSWWLPNGREINFSFSNKSNSVASKPESPTGNGSEEKPLGLQLMDRDSSPTQSVGHTPQPHQDASATKVVYSQDQSYSSESGQDDSCGRSMDEQMKPLLLYGTTSENMFNPSQVDHGHPMVQVPYGVADPYLGGLLSTYGPHAIIQPQIGNQMMGMATNRVPLPFNLAVDGPIYVNAKQYHGILRRRQSRAKLEAQNKLVKTRKPYLHESRHLHALNRVRGTGGRFLSTKKTQPPNMAYHQDHGSGGGDSHRFPPSTTCSEIASGSNSGSLFLNSDRTGLRVSGSMVQQTGGLMFGASGNWSSSVR